MKIQYHYALLIFLLYSLGLKGQANAETLTLIDSLVKQKMKKWKVPAVSLSIVKDSTVFLTKGYGIRNLETSAPADEHTLFGIASNTKAFTATGVALLVEQGKLDWDKPLVEYLPDFKMQDSYATQHIAMRDLLSHRSGLPRHDMLWHSSGLNPHQIYERIQYLPATEPLYKTFQYNNVMYVAAGVALEKISGFPYEEWITTELLRPLGMTETIWFDKDLRSSTNFAAPYLSIEGDLKVAPVLPHNDVTNAAGGIKSSAKDMANWMMFHLNKGKLNAQQLIRPRLVAEMHTGQIMVREANSFEKGAVLSGLGWMISTYKGHNYIYHNGARPGYWSHIALMPKEGFSIYVNSNIESNSVHFVEMLAHTLTDYLLEFPETDWQSIYWNRQAQMEQQQKMQASYDPPAQEPNKALNAYIGTYEHPAFGIITTQLEDDSLIANFRQQDFQLRALGGDNFAGKTGDNFVILKFLSSEDSVNAVESNMQGVPIEFKKVH